jgi:hypothetical protein
MAERSAPMTDAGPTIAAENPLAVAGYLTEGEAAAQLGVAARTLRLWRQQRQGPPFLRLGQRILYRREAITEWLRSMESDRRGAKTRRA